MHAETIIIGAGSSGAVIAARATEQSDRDVLLLEAGPDYPDALPADLRDGTRNSMRLHDWTHLHRPTPGHRTLFWFPRGRVVGGSSAVNTCIALRGSPADYDEWASRGLPDWSWDACLPAFKRLEDDRDVHNAWHGQGGPIPIRRHPASELRPWQAAFVDGCRRMGFPACDDSNDPTTTGVGPHAMNKVDGERMSVARGYLTPAVRKRDNLRIMASTLVRRVLFSGRRVTGVEVETGGRVASIASSRVIVCAGATATPGILLRSGVGPRGAVERIGVHVVSDVPAVGARLLDHPGTAIFLRPRRGIQSPRDPLIQTALRYTSKRSTQKNDMLLQPGSIVPLRRMTLPLVSVMCSVGKPRGWGTIEFPSADPHGKPIIHSRLLVDAEDRARAVEAMRMAADLVASEPMRSMVAGYFWPWSSAVKNDANLSRWIGRICDSGYHPCGTVPMGADDADSAVAATDGRGRVRGVEGLYVADASLMPTITSANTNLTVMMMGERFGEWMKRGEL